LKVAVSWQLVLWQSTSPSLGSSHCQEVLQVLLRLTGCCWHACSHACSQPFPFAQGYVVA